MKKEIVIQWPLVGRKHYRIVLVIHPNPSVRDYVVEENRPDALDNDSWHTIAGTKEGDSVPFWVVQLLDTMKTLEESK
jgi:hypothetical protein